ncbi:hypothetical protein DSOUD_0900 [Desulfuromonas soudanensis]|uniref:Uncharacterized protein n=1 Tax=Desulfuromonas soudanensis TaxID=1603606 RepID=A0A0M4DFX5_9BACT|nr:hypothetical protein [Desulfuromonas soudanensis]ALC15687.1 hypothetical protein DSOUD_0900 [Desulfuromonas soudanensis]
MKRLVFATMGVGALVFGMTWVFFDPLTIYGTLLALVFFAMATLGIFLPRPGKKGQFEEDD